MAPELCGILNTGLVREDGAGVGITIYVYIVAGCILHSCRRSRTFGTTNHGQIVAPNRLDCQTSSTGHPI